MNVILKRVYHLTIRESIPFFLGLELKGEKMSNKETITSDVTGKTYCVSEVVRILNIQQIIAYLKYGVELLDIYPSSDYETGKPLLVCLFDRESSKKAYDLWCKRQLN